MSMCLNYNNNNYYNNNYNYNYNNNNDNNNSSNNSDDNNSNSSSSNNNNNKTSKNNFKTKVLEITIKAVLILFRIKVVFKLNHSSSVPVCVCVQLKDFLSVLPFCTLFPVLFYVSFLSIRVQESCINPILWLVISCILHRFIEHFYNLLYIIFWK